MLLFQTICQFKKHFKRYAQTARKKVKVIVTDMNYIYLKLTKTIFSNVIVIIDKFHLTNPLKRYWKLLLVPREQLDYEHFFKWIYFPYYGCCQRYCYLVIKA